MSRYRYLYLWSLAFVGFHDTQAHPSYAFVNGFWFNGRGFDKRTMYVVNDTLASRRPTTVDSVVDLRGAFVVPPYADAHNHNAEFFGEARARALVARYFAAGVFYDQNPATVERARDGMRGLANTPTGIDVRFAIGGITASGGHPTGLYLRNAKAGVFTPADSDGGFLWIVDSLPDLDRKWPEILARKPDFIKAFLLYSEQYDRRKNDPVFFNWRGLNPAILPEVVRRAHAAGLRVMAHIETAGDFHNALVAGVDEIGHMPGFRGDEQGRLENPQPYVIADSDAARAARQATTVITTLQAGAGRFVLTGPDSLARRRFDELNRTNLRTLKRHHVRLAIGSDNYGSTSVAEAMYLQQLGVFSNLELLKLWSEATPAAIFPERHIGRLLPGYEATFLALEANPLIDFGATERIRLRVKQGHVRPEAASLQSSGAPSGAVVDCSRRAGAIDSAISEIGGRQRDVGLAVAISSGDSIVYTRYIGFADLEDSTPVSSRTRFPIASVTKTFTAAAGLRLAEHGQFDWDAPIQRYVPQFPTAAFPVTPRLIAAQLAGIRHWGSERDARLFARHFSDVRDVLPLFIANPFVADTAVGYSYSSYAYDLLGAAIEAASGRDFQAVVRDELLTPLHLRATDFDDARAIVPYRTRLYTYYDPDTRAQQAAPIRMLDRDYSHNMAGGNMVTTAEDLATFGAALRAPGFLSTASWQSLYSRPRAGAFVSPMSYGVFVATDTGTLRHIYMNGADPGTQAGLAVYPALGLSLAVLTNTWGIGSASAELVSGDSTGLMARIVARCSRRE